MRLADLQTKLQHGNNDDGLPYYSSSVGPATVVLEVEDRDDEAATKFALAGAPYYYRHHYYEGVRPHQSGARVVTMEAHRSCSCLYGLPQLVFLVFLIYGVAVSHTDAVKSECSGDSNSSKLWTYMLVRLVLLCCNGLFECVVGGGLVGGYILMLRGGQAAPAVAALLSGLWMVLCMLVFYCTMLGVGVPIVMDALNSPACAAALSDASAWTHTPVLAIVGAIFIGLDALSLLVVLLVSCAGALGATVA
jgi:hypothetical protein